MLKSKNHTNDDSADLEGSAQTELQPLIQHDVKIPTRKQARTARIQFLALCWCLFLLGWLVGGTGPLLPSIQKSYGVSQPTFLNLPGAHHVNCTDRVRGSLLVICFGMYGQWCLSGRDTRCRVALRLYDHTLPYFLQGGVLGALLNMTLIDKLGLGKVSF